MTQLEAKKHLKRITSEFANQFKPNVITTYQYWGKVIKIVDGDTLDIEISLGFNLSAKERFRLIGINTPEIFGKKHSSTEYAEGIKSKIYLEKLIPTNTWIEVSVFYAHREKFGRWLCEIFHEGKSVNVNLLANGLATPY